MKRVTDVAAIHPDDKKMLIKVICGPYETWPLPWYLRGFESVGYWQEAGEAGRLLDVPVIISDQDQAGKLRPLLEDKFQSEYYGLRPGVVLVLHIREDLWQKYLKHRILP